MDAEHTDSLLPDLDYFELQVIQADLDRDPFAIALFELEPVGRDYSDLLPRLARCLLDFASPSTHVASLGNDRLAILARTDDTTHRWVAPVGTALQAVLDEWLDTDDHGRRWRAGDPHSPGSSIAALIDPAAVAELVDRPRLISGAARGLTQQVWLNAEAALAKAHKRQLSFVEHSGPGVDLLSVADRRATVEPADRVAGRDGTGALTDTDDDERLVVMCHRIEPVGRPEPAWLWLRLAPGLQPSADSAAQPIDLDDLNASERAMLEVWLAGRIGPLFADTNAQLRVTLPITAEAARARSFAQRIFPLLEHHRIPPTRVVLEIDTAALTAEPGRDDEASYRSQPSTRRFIEDAAAVNVSVVVTNFDGGWAAWRSIHKLPISYISPPAELFRHADTGDAEAIRSLDFIGADADDRGIELIVPDVDTDLSPELLAGLGFSYQQSPVSTAVHALAPHGPGVTRKAGGSYPTAS